MTEEKKRVAREWWILEHPSDKGLFALYHSNPKWIAERDTLYHVVEVSAYQQALEQISKLEKALEYYGDGKNWLHVSHNPFIKNNCGSDGGATANQALAELKKWRGENGE